MWQTHCRFVHFRLQIKLRPSIPIQHHQMQLPSIPEQLDAARRTDLHKDGDSIRTTEDIELTSVEQPPGHEDLLDKIKLKYISLYQLHKQSLTLKH